MKLDITKPSDAESAVKAAVEKFGRIDVLVNNAAYEESTSFAERTIKDYDERRAKQMEFWRGHNGLQACGDTSTANRCLPEALFFPRILVGSR